MESCTLCVHRLDAADDNRTTACAEACTAAGHDAILFGDLNDPNGLLATRLRTEPSRALREDLELNAAVRYQGL